MEEDSSSFQSSSDDVFAKGPTEKRHIDEAYRHRKVKFESDGEVRSISRDVLRRASISADAIIAKASADGTLKPREKESRVMVLYSGGTIGMGVIDSEFKSIPNYLPKTLRSVPHLHDKEYAQLYFSELSLKPYVLPPVKDEQRRILYWLFEYDPLLDSSNTTVDDWIKIAKDIYRSYDEYDGFVILHGTDTLCYTASALSFLFDNLGKPIILTGAQIPITEVAIYFNNNLFRGNRTIKLDINSFDTFKSPNYAPLAQMGIHINVDWNRIYRSSIPEKVTIRTSLSNDIGLLRIFPSMSLHCVKAFFNGNVKGIVLQTFGAGNLPSHRVDILQELQDAIQRGVIIVNVSQCCIGVVESRYRTGKILTEIGVVNGCDMTPEAALTKLSYVISFENLSLEEKKLMLSKNLRGELGCSSDDDSSSLSRCEVLKRFSKTLHLSTTEEIIQLRDTIFPPLICHAASQGDVISLKQLRDQGAVLHHRNFEKRTALHIASAHGRIEVVQYLLSEGVSVHARDDNDATPLTEAVESCHLEIIKLLRKAGAHLKMNPVVLGTELCKYAATNGLQEVCQFLLQNGALPSMQDSFRCTPISNARKNDHHNIIALIEFCTTKESN
uniref:asparaginase n=1 Tax=Romanomermis culicivorax TaxID=13658 RepID=A0A915JQD6_ROMCU